MDRNDADLMTAKSLLSDGHTYRGVSIGMGIGGVALVAAGAYLPLTPHHQEAASHVSVQVGHDDDALTFTGSF